MKALDFPKPVAVHLGRGTHLWNIRARDYDDRLVAQAKLTMIVLDRPLSHA